MTTQSPAEFLQSYIQELKDQRIDLFKDYQKSLTKLNKGFKEAEAIFLDIEQASINQYQERAIKVCRTKYAMNYVDSYGKMLEPNGIWFEKEGMMVSWILSDNKVSERVVTWTELTEGV